MRSFAAPPILPVSLLVAFSWHAIWIRSEFRRRAIVAEITVVSLGVFWITQAAFGQLGLAVSFPPFSYAAEIRDAIDRRAALVEIAAQVVKPIAAARGASALIAPTLDGPYLALRYPSLFEYNLSTDAPFLGPEISRLRLVRNAAMHPWRAPDVATVASLRDAVSPEFLALLVRNPTVRDTYFAPVPLQVTRGARTPDAGDTAPIVSDGTAAHWLRREAFDPETTPRLRLAIDRLDPGPDRGITLAVTFTPDLAAAEGRASVYLAPGSDAAIEADLRQLYAFALSRRVTDLRVIFVEPGQYRIRHAAVVP